MVDLFVLVTLAVLAVVAQTRRGLLSPAVLYLLVWTGVVVVASLPSQGYRSITPVTWHVVVIGSAAFLVGCITAAGLVKTRVPDSARTGLLYQEDKLNRWYKLALGALIASTALDVYRVLPLLTSAGGLSGILGGGGLGFRESTLQASAQAATTNFATGSLVTSIAGYLFFAGYITLIWGAYYATQGKWLRAIGPLAIVALYSLLTIQRFQFVYSFLIFAFAYRYHRRLTRPARRRSPRSIVALGALVLLVVFIPLQLRGQATSGGQRIESVLDYLGGGLASFNTTLSDHVSRPAPSPGYGEWTFYGLATIAKRLGVPVNLPPTYLPYQPIATNRVVNTNVDTYLIYPYYDLGVPGLVLFAFALGAVATALDRGVRKRTQLRLVAAASVASTTVVMSFFSLSLLRDFRWLYLIALAAVLTPRLIQANEVQTEPASRSSARHLASAKRPAVVGSVVPELMPR